MLSVTFLLFVVYNYVLDLNGGMKWSCRRSHAVFFLVINPQCMCTGLYVSVRVFVWLTAPLLCGSTVEQFKTIIYWCVNAFSHFMKTLHVFYENAFLHCHIPCFLAPPRLINLGDGYWLSNGLSDTWFIFTDWIYVLWGLGLCSSMYCKINHNIPLQWKLFLLHYFAM